MKIVPEGFVPRAVISVAAGLLAGFGAHERLPGADVARERNMEVEACAAQLGQSAMIAAKVPAACEPYEAAGFLSNEIKVVVRAPLKDGETIPASAVRTEEVVKLPPAENFRSENSIDPEAVEDDKDEAGVAAGIVGAGLLFMYMSAIVRERRRTERDTQN